MFSAVRPLLAAATLLWAAASQAQNMPSNARAYLNAENGSTIGYELDAPVTWEHGLDGGAFTSITPQGQAGDGVTVVYQDEGLKWAFQFSANKGGTGEALSVGMYDKAGMAGSTAPGQAGLLISSPFGMMAQASGWFNVLEIGYGDDGSLERFAVDFRQFENAQMKGPSVIGSLRYNSSLALQSTVGAVRAAANVPEPATLAMMLAALFLMVSVGRRKTPLKA
ncbi:MAG: PEP-CTERM sorting domain-containing protein [Pseudomonadota bacterium]